MNDYMENELYHFGVKGMRWGVRKDKKKSGNVPRKHLKGDKVDLVQKEESSFAKLLAKVLPSVAKQQRAYSDYDIKDKLGNTVGNISTNDDGKGSMNIIWLGVNKNSSGKGYAQSAMKTVIADAKKNGFREITLEVPGNSPNARHIYEKLGFKERGTEILGDVDDIWGGLTEMKLDLYSDELKHFGVKGMRWGVRKDRKPNYHPKKQKVKRMSDSDLRRDINRLNMEKQYKDLTASPARRAGKRVVQGIFVAAAFETSKVFVSKYAKTGLEYLATAAGNKAVDLAGNVVGKAVEKAFNR